MGYASGIDPGGGRSKKAHQAQQAREEDISQIASPERFLQFYESLLPQLRELGEPDRIRLSDQAALRGQNLMRAFKSDVGQRGIAGSGFDLFGAQGIRGGTQAEIAQAALQYYMDAMRRASDEAGRIQNLYVQGLSSTPIMPKTGIAA